MSTLLSMKSGENHSTFLMIDEEEQTVYVNGELCSLTQQEFSLLQELLNASQMLHDLPVPEFIQLVYQAIQEIPVM